MTLGLLSSGGFSAGHLGDCVGGAPDRHYSEQRPIANWLGETAAKIRDLRPPEPYKGQGNQISRKSSSSAKRGKASGPSAGK